MQLQAIKFKTILFWKMEDDLNLFERGRRLTVFKNENDLKKNYATKNN